jgi:hypothetical protein
MPIDRVPRASRGQRDHRDRHHRHPGAVTALGLASLIVSAPPFDKSLEAFAILQLWVLQAHARPPCHSTGQATSLFMTGVFVETTTATRATSPDLLTLRCAPGARNVLL